MTFKGHINPAVTWAIWITRRISLLRASVYVVCQIFGGIVGSALLKSILPEEIQFGMGCHTLNPEMTVSNIFFGQT
jgi:glycerol uptake facilitator-like aquaporin